MSKRKSEVGYVQKLVPVDLSEAETMSTAEVELEMAKVGVDILSLDRLFGRLIGKVLTQIDASIVDPVQRKALKDVLRQLLQAALEEIFMLSDGRKVDQAEESVG